MRTWMRWAACAAGVGLGLLPMTGRAQETEETQESKAGRRTVLLALPTVGLVGLSGQLGLGVEHAVSPHVTLVGLVQVGGSTHHSESPAPAQGNSTSQTWGVGVGPGVHFYFAGRAPEGFWVGPDFELSTLHSSTRNQFLTWKFPVPSEGELTELVTLEGSSRMVSYGGTLRVGYTAILSPGLTLQVGAGLAAFASRSTFFGSPALGGVGSQPNLLGQRETRGWSVAPRMSVGVGWAF